MCHVRYRNIMGMSEQLETFIATNKDSIRMGVLAGQLEEAIKIIFNAGYEAAVSEIIEQQDLSEQNLGDWYVWDREESPTTSGEG